MPRLRRGDIVTYTRGGNTHYGVYLQLWRFSSIHTNYHKVLEYGWFMQPSELRVLPYHQLTLCSPEVISKLNNDAREINIGRLQYNQHFFRSPKHKKTEWRKGYERYKKLCRDYNVPVNPKRSMPDLPESR